MSHYHCIIEKDQLGTYRIADLNSTNGTCVNGKRITKQTLLKPNDRVRIGRSILTWATFFGTAQHSNQPTVTPRKKYIQPTQQQTHDKPYDVFVSYSHKDKMFVSELCSTLQNSGVSLWVDKSRIRHGLDFKETIVDALSHCKILLFISSPKSNQSANTIKKVGLAESYGKISSL